MKILLVNKFLYNKGGSETYMFQLAELLKSHAFQYDFWGMADKNNSVQDTYSCFAENINYSELKGLNKYTKLIDTIYSFANRKNIQIILDEFKPDIVHIHNYNFQLTPSILPEINKRGIKIVQTVHDSQMVCPYHRMYNYQQKSRCDKCIEGAFYHCIFNRCFDASLPKSVIGCLESTFYHFFNCYNKYIDLFISPSHFLAKYLKNKINKPISVLPNFVTDLASDNLNSHNDYILYFGRIAEEKGIFDIQKAFIKMNKKLMIIGDGLMKEKIISSEYIEYLGPKYGSDLFNYIKQAKYVIQPSKWFENCPMTVIESFMCGVPVIASDHGGFPEMISDNYNGFLLNFEQNYDDALYRILNMDSTNMYFNCRKTYLEKYAPEVHFRQINRLYEEVLNESI